MDLNIDEFDITEYEDYLNTLSRKELKSHAVRVMMNSISLMQENEQLKQQVSRSNSQHLSHCRSVSSVTPPPGV